MLFIGHDDLRPVGSVDPNPRVGRRTSGTAKPLGGLDADEVVALFISLVDEISSQYRRRSRRNSGRSWGDWSTAMHRIILSLWCQPLNTGLEHNSHISLYRVIWALTLLFSRVIKKLCERICVVYSCLCFVTVNQLHLFAMNIKEHHWLVHQPISPLTRYYTSCPTTEHRSAYSRWSVLDVAYIRPALLHSIDFSTNITID